MEASQSAINCLIREQWKGTGVITPKLEAAEFRRGGGEVSGGRRWEVKRWRFENPRKSKKFVKKRIHVLRLIRHESTFGGSVDK